MSSVFSAEDVRRLARLCALELEDDAIEPLRADLERIVAHVRRVEDSVAELDASPPRTSFEASPPLRSDEPQSSPLSRDGTHLARGSLLELPGLPRR